jgi:hypothetical protein
LAAMDKPVIDEFFDRAGDCETADRELAGEFGLAGDALSWRQAGDDGSQAIRDLTVKRSVGIVAERTSQSAPPIVQSTGHTAKSSKLRNGFFHGGR